MRQRTRPARRRGFAGVGLLLAGLLLGAYLGFGPGPTARSGTSTLVLLPRGSGVSEVSRALKSAGVIRSEILFQVLARATGAGRSLKAGEYDISSRAPVLSVLSDLQAGRTLHRSVTLPEGRTSAMIVRQLQNTEWLSGVVEFPEEGVLLPETYRADRGDSRQSLVDRMRSDQQALLDRLWAARQPGLPLNSPREAVILASIVEKETGQADERRRVAGVFINRLRMGMRLQSDPTAIYAISRGEPLGRGLKASELLSRSPWNTYAYSGLPPTPIANPGKASLEAVLDPIQTQELYFVADGSGGHVFARTLSEHEANVARWREVERARAGGG